MKPELNAIVSLVYSIADAIKHGALPQCYDILTACSNA